MQTEEQYQKRETLARQKREALETSLQHAKKQCQDLERLRKRAAEQINALERQVLHLRQVAEQSALCERQRRIETTVCLDALAEADRRIEEGELTLRAAQEEGSKASGMSACLVVERDEALSSLAAARKKKQVAVRMMNAERRSVADTSTQTALPDDHDHHQHILDDASPLEIEHIDYVSTQERTPSPILSNDSHSSSSSPRKRGDRKGRSDRCNRDKHTPGDGRANIDVAALAKRLDFMEKQMAKSSWC